MAPLLLLPVALSSLLVGCALDHGVTRFNTAPEVAITSHTTGGEIGEGQQLILRGSISDPNNEFEDLVIEWYGGDDELCLENRIDEDGSSLCATALAADQGVIVLVATDPEGAAASATVTLDVLPGIAPAVTVESPQADAHYYSDDPVHFLASVQDDGPWTDLQLSWESSLDGPLDVATLPDSSGQAEGYATLSQGDHQLTLTVTDGAGLSDTVVMLIEVGPPNTAPSCELVSPETGTLVVQGEPTTFLAMVDDPDVDATDLSVTWQSDRDGTLGSSNPGSAGDVTFVSSDLGAGSHVVTMLVQDDQGESCTDMVELEVTAPPAVSVGSPVSGTTVDEGDSVTFTATATDEEDSATALSVTISSSLDGTLWTGSPDSAGNINVVVDDLSRGSHEITVAATDSSELTTAVEVDLDVNGAPSAPVVSLGPDGADSTQDLVVTVDTAAEDLDGDTVSYSYQWYRDGSLVTSGSDTLSSTYTARDEAWSVVVTSNDGRLDGGSDSASITIENAAPEVSAVELTPADPSRNDTITATATTSDPDGDSVTVTWDWYVNGATVSPSGDYLTSSFFERDDEVYAVAFPSDGTSTGDTLASDTITVVNAPPTEPVVAIDPADPVELVDDLLCDISTSSTDADGDSVSVSIEWTVDGDSYGVDEDSGAGWTGPDTTTWDDDTVPAEDTVEGQEWTCTVTVSDGEDSASVSADPVEIQGVFEFESSQDIDGATVTCSSTDTTTEYTECQDLEVDGLYLANGVGCTSAWSTVNSDYSDYEGLCESLTGSTTFEAYYLCATVDDRATWNDGVWDSRTDNGYTQAIRCYYP